MELVHIYNVIVLSVALLFDFVFISWNRKKKMFTKGETAFWAVAIVIWTFWAYYIAIGSML